MNDAGVVPAALSVASDGSLHGGPGASRSVRVPLNAARLQAQVNASGVSELFVWGSGVVGRLVIEPPLGGATAMTVRPNSVTYTLPRGTVRITALPVRPAVVLEFNGVAAMVRLAPTRTRQPGSSGRFELSVLADGWAARSPWATAVLRAPAGEVGSRGRVEVAGAAVVVLGLGASGHEAEAAAETVLTDPRGSLAAAEEYAAGLKTAFDCDDALLKCLFVACQHAARSSRKELEGGRFAGFSAGLGYALPPRTYFRDSYWTLQALLPFQPNAAVEQLRVLAGAVADDGECPSGVIAASDAANRAWRARIATDPALAAAHTRPGQWWSDHFDSPYLFVLLARDALTWSLAAGRDEDGAYRNGAALGAAVEEPVGGVSLAEKVVAVLRRGRRLAGSGSLPIKPFNDRDWADNVFRHGYVTYDVALYHGALEAGAELLSTTRPAVAAEFRMAAAAVRKDASRLLFDRASGHFLEFRPAPGGAERLVAGETHLTLDSLVALRTGLATSEQADAVLAATGRLLETRHNREQPYGDWGVMATYPPYRPTTQRRAKSLFAYRYHNGSDWPYLDGIYAEALLARGHSEWRYPLTRWFEYGLKQGWPTPVEYYAPPWGRGSPLNGWSSMPAAALLLGGLGLRPVGAPRTPPWGDCVVNGVLVDGRRSIITVEGGRVTTVALDDGHG